MILILPFAHRITGDYALTAACLSALLKEEVKYRIFEIEKSFEIKDNHSLLRGTNWILLTWRRTDRRAGLS